MNHHVGHSNSNRLKHRTTGYWHGIVAALVVLGSLTLFPAIPHAGQTKGDCVILIHGLGRTANSMDRLEEKLVRKGYRVWNQDYPSRDADIETLAENYMSMGIKQCMDQDTAAIHFVTHSMGGILVRQYFQSKTLDQLGKIVMLAPPNHGSEVVNHLKDASIFQNTMGPAAQQLSTDKNSKPNSLKPISGTIGVIAGSVTSDPWFSWMFEGPNDGKVSVESTRLSEMTDFLVVEHGHTFIMNYKDVTRQVVFFLQNGIFKKPRVEGDI